jgi:hypothetical protein
VFDHWWIQTIRFLAESRLQRGGTRGRLSTDRDRYAVGDVVTISAELYDAAFRPVTDETAPILLLPPDGKSLRRELLATATAGRYRGTYVVSQTGLHTLACAVPGSAGETGTRLEQRFTVEKPVVEFVKPELAETALRRAAEQTDGAYADISGLAALIRKIPDRTETITLPEEPIPVWDHWWLLILVLCLLGTEWAVRRRYQMI